MRYSFVIPVFRTERYLPRCLDSIAAQSAGDFEVVVVDDCSPRAESGVPTAAEIVARYDARFRFMRHDRNKGAFQARLTAIRSARGDYVIPVDPDDYVMPELLTRADEVIVRDDPDMISYRMEYDNGSRIYPHWCRHPDALVTGAEALSELAQMKFFTGIASKIFRRDCMLAGLARLAPDADLYVNTSDDLLMLLPLLLCSRKVAFVGYVGYRYFVNGSSTSFSWATEAGYEKATRQTREVVDLVDRMARGADVDDRVRADVRTVLTRVERFFVRCALDGGYADRFDFLKIALRHLHPESVALELADEVQKLRTSRMIRLAGVLRKLTAVFGRGGGR